MIVAILFALFITSYFTYVYDTVNLTIGKINLFPLVAWTAGLVILREVYERWRLPRARKFFTITLLYWGVLFVFEFVGYYLLGIRIGHPYHSLFGLGIIHGPPVIHLFYITAGPLYLAVTDYLRVR